MKMEHIELVFESVERFEKASLTLADFLERLGKALESASVREAKAIGEIARKLEYAIFEGADEDVASILRKMKVIFLAQLKSNAN